MKKIKENLLKLKKHSEIKVKENFSGKADLLLFIIVIILGLFILHAYYQGFNNYYNSNESEKMILDLRENILKNDYNKPLSYHYLSSGDIYCLYKNGEELFIKNNIIFFVNDEKGYYATFGNTIINDFDFDPIDDNNSEVFFEALGKPIECKINASEENGFYKKALTFVNKIL